MALRGQFSKKNNNLQNQEESFWFLRMALYHVLIAQEYSRHSQLQESCLNIFHLPIFDRFMAYRRSKKNFGPNVIYCFLGYMNIVWRYHMELSYGDIIWRYHMVISYGDIVWWYRMVISYGDIIWWYDMEMFDFYWIFKHKFHGLVGPPGAIFEKKKTTTCKTKKKSFDFWKWF